MDRQPDPIAGLARSGSVERLLALNPISALLIINVTIHVGGGFLGYIGDLLISRKVSIALYIMTWIVVNCGMPLVVAILLDQHLGGRRRRALLVAVFGVLYLIALVLTDALLPPNGGIEIVSDFQGLLLFF